MLCHDLKHWKIFNTLEPEFMSKIHIAVVYGDLGDKALIVTNDDMVYAIGTNANSCLGTGNNSDTFNPITIAQLCKKNIKTFAFGKDHVLALTKQGPVYSWGKRDHNRPQCSSSYHGTSVTPSIMINTLSDEHIVSIGCGTYHSLALTNKGKVYAWACADSTRKTYPVLNDEIIVCCACGKEYSMVVTIKGEVYGWGENKVGQIGVGNYCDVESPRKVIALNGVVIEKVVCGYMHTLALSNEGALYVWGGNSSGQLGHGSTLENNSVPLKLEVEAMGRVRDIAALHCSHISVAMGKENRVFIWGQCLGQNIIAPRCTPLRYLHDAFAYYAWPRVTYQPLLFNKKGLSLSNNLDEAFDDQVTSDFIIKVQGRSIYVHKAILKIRCQYFRTMFQDNWAENTKSDMSIDKFSYEVYKLFLKYLYTEKINAVSDSELVELLELADMYLVSHLKEHCIQMLMKKVTLENIAFFYTISFKYHTKELEKCCFKFALNHMTAVIQNPDFLEMDKKILNCFLIEAARAGAFKT
ncbi:RCC1 and BTB domain-containing protein 1-like [Osmia bicornis bicornis]|uniref:RCC1 and BTB domain-containing protein 1-like n=1 Tax=Osmia bicornis bicornis TaxID=1437191 RepID=UPI001EAF535F|nr:RCC1 and BTB domain-containing protein 1-like [Osmia bicornis bicornis]